MEISIKIGQAVGIFSIGTIVGIGLILSYIYYPERYQRIAYHIYWLLSLIPIARKYLVYKKIGTKFESKINLAGKNINAQAPGVLPHAMKFEWAKTGDAVKAFLRNGDIVIRMRHDDDQEISAVVSTLAYLEKDLLYDVRHYVDPTLMQATDYTVTKSLLSDMDLDRAISYLMTNCIEPAILANPQLEPDCNALDTISDAGYLTRILLPQLLFLKKKLWPNTTTGAIRKETRGFMEFVHKLSEQKGEDELLPPLDYLQPRIKVRVLLAARKEIKLYGMKYHIRRIKEAQLMGIEYLYICGWGHDNVEFIKSLAKSQEKEGRLSILHTNEFTRQFDERGVTAICIVTALNLNISPKDTSNSTEMARAIIEENVEEILSGQIEIMAIGREPGVITMVAVRSLSKEVDCIECITKQYKSGKLGSLFNQEKFYVLPWCEEPEHMIATALLHSRLHDNISLIELDSQRKHAVVRISSEDVRRIAVGKQGVNVRVASELTGWVIDVRNTNEDS